MSDILNIALARTSKTLPVDVAALPTNVARRLVELGLTAHLRSSVNSAFSGELEKAFAETETEARAAHDADQKAKLAKNPKHKVVPYKRDEKAFRAFAEKFEFETDPVEVANTRLAALLNGEIRMARGTSGANKVLSKLVRTNIISVLMAKGKKAKEAAAMVGDDPFQFIEKTARKRAGDDDAAFKVELAKLNAQYVDPAKALLTPEQAADGEEGGADDVAGDLL